MKYFPCELSDKNKMIQFNTLPIVSCKLNSVSLFPVVRKMSKIPLFKPASLH